MDPQKKPPVIVATLGNPFLPGMALLNVSLTADAARAFLAGRGAERRRIQALSADLRREAGCQHAIAALSELDRRANADELATTTQPPDSEVKRAARAEAIEEVARCVEAETARRVATPPDSDTYPGDIAAFIRAIGGR